MKNWHWQKLAVTASLSLVLGFSAGYLLRPKTQPVIKEEPKKEQVIETKKHDKKDFFYYSRILLKDKIFNQGSVDYSELVEAYKSLNLDGLVKEDFWFWGRSSNDYEAGTGKPTRVIERFEAEKEHLHIDLLVKLFFDETSETIGNWSSFELNVSNRKNIIFESLYDSNENPHTIKMRRYNPNNKEGEPFTEKEIIFEKDFKNQGGFHVTYLDYKNDKEDLHLRYDKDITAEKEIKIIQELFDIANKQYQIARNLILKP